MKKIWKRILLVVLVIVLIISAFIGGFMASNNLSSLMPPIDPVIDQDPASYGEDELAVLAASETFWTAMEAADEAGMRSVSDPNCTFVHIGMTVKLDEEIQCYTSGMFQPTELVIHEQSVDIYGDTAVVLSDVDYALLLGGMETSHHFAVTEVFTRQADGWKLVQFSFTALSS